MQDKNVIKLTDQDAALLEQGASMLEGLENDERNRGNCSTAEGAGCSAHAVRRLASALLAHEREIGQCLHQISEPAAVAGPIEPTGWREQFAAAVYDDLAAADNQDVPLEEYPARILKVLDLVVGPRHPAIVKWRNDAIQACAAIAYRYCRDPESHQYLKQDLQALITAAPALEAPGDVVRTFRDYISVHEVSGRMNGRAMDDMALDLARIALDFRHLVKDAAPQAQHQGMTVAGDGAADLGKLMRKQWEMRGGVYPDGNPNSGQP